MRTPSPTYYNPNDLWDRVEDHFSTRRNRNSDDDDDIDDDDDDDDDIDDEDEDEEEDEDEPSPEDLIAEEEELKLRGPLNHVEGEDDETPEVVSIPEPVVSYIHVDLPKPQVFEAAFKPVVGCPLTELREASKNLNLAFQRHQIAKANALRHLALQRHPKHYVRKP
jgi:hypothetical protein